MNLNNNSDQTGGISLAGLTCLVSTFLVSGTLFWLAAPDQSASPVDRAASVSAPLSQETEHEVGYCPISQMKLGQRTLGSNPLRDEVPTNLQAPDPTFWREVHLQVDDESQEAVTIQLLRPLGWLYAQNVWEGNRIPLELTELHVDGEAVVTFVGPCPPIRPGPGNVVTGKYIHKSANNLIDLTIEGDSQPTGVTTNHPYWSMDRQRFLEAGDLNPGEHVDTRYGPRQVLSLTPRSNQPVYNLEVHGEHVYRVGTLGTLVHNIKLSTKARGKTPDEYSEFADTEQIAKIERYLNRRGIEIKFGQDALLEGINGRPDALFAIVTEGGKDTLTIFLRKNFKKSDLYEEAIHAVQRLRNIKDRKLLNGIDIDFHEFQAKKLLIRHRHRLEIPDSQTNDTILQLLQVVRGEY